MLGEGGILLRRSWPGEEGLDPLLLHVVPFSCQSAVAASGGLQ